MWYCTPDRSLSTCHTFSTPSSRFHPTSLSSFILKFLIMGMNDIYMRLNENVRYLYTGDIAQPCSLRFVSLWKSLTC